MRIIHLSYARIPGWLDPEAWLKKLSFFTIMLEKTAEFADVKSIHLIEHSGVINRKGVEYHFLNTSVFDNIFPVFVNRYVKNLEPDIVVVHGLVFPLQVLLLRSQLASKVRITMIHHAEKPLGFPKSIFQKMADRFIDAYFFNSVLYGRLWVERKLIRDMSKIHEVMIGSSVFHPIDRSFSKMRTKTEGSQIFLWVGQLDLNKDPITLVNGFMMYNAHHAGKKLYLIYQDADLLDEVRTLVAQTDQIVLVGRVDHPELQYWYNSADVIISTSHYEGGGTAVCEAMSCGCFPILTRIPSFVMMTDNGKVGFLFEPGNHRQLYEVLTKTDELDLVAERERIVRHFHQKLSNDVIVEKMMRVFKTLRDQ